MNRNLTIKLGAIALLILLLLIPLLSSGMGNGTIYRKTLPERLMGWRKGRIPGSFRFPILSTS